MMKKLFTFALVTVLSISLLAPASAFALTPLEDQLKKITDLTLQIKALQDQINNLQTQQTALQQTASQTAFEIAQGLKQGTEGDQVKLLQTLLALDTSIYPEGKVTGYFGPMTRKALERFQRNNGLDAVGFIGPRTRSLLEKLFKAHFREAKEVEDDIEDDVENELDRFLGALPVVPDASCAIPANPYATTSPFHIKDGKTKIISNGNTLIYKDGKHKIIITPNSYIEKDGKKKLLITPGYRIEMDGKHKSFLRCGTGTSTPPFPPPGQDTTPPTLSAIQALATYQSATISWITNEPATGKVYYGTTTPLIAVSSSMLSNGSLQTGHSFNLTGLLAATTYYFLVESKDMKGNTATSSQQSFVTSATPDTTAPVISAIGSSVGTSTATITWNTNESANSKVYYSTTSPLATSTASVKTDAALVTGHSLQLTGLTPGVTHYFKVESTDGSGNTSLSSETSFATVALDVTPPVISAVSALPTASTTATVTWTTNESATSKVYYGLTTPLATSTASVVSSGAFVTSHNLGLSLLTASTTYYVIVESSDSTGNKSTGSEISFATLP